MPASTSIRSLVPISSFKSSGLSENLILTNAFMTFFLSLSQLTAVNPLIQRPRDLATRELVVYNFFFCYSGVIKLCRFFPLIRLFYAFESMLFVLEISWVPVTEWLVISVNSTECHVRIVTIFPKLPRAQLIGQHIQRSDRVPYTINDQYITIER